MSDHKGGLKSCLLSNSVNSLKFSIEKILSPEFGRPTNSASKYARGERRPLELDEVDTGSKAKKPRCSFDISSLTGKRKHSSDSESSTTSSTFSTTSKDSLNQKFSSPPSSAISPISCGKVSSSFTGTPTDNTSNDSIIPKENNSHTSNNSRDKKPVKASENPVLNGLPPWVPAWVHCTRYSDRPSSGPRSRRMKKREKKPDEKRPRTAFTAEQLARLKQEFQDNRYLTEKRRKDLAEALKLNESQIKIWFQNKRAKIKKANGHRNRLAGLLMAQGLYNHSTVAVANEDYADEESDSSRRSYSTCSENTKK